MTDTDEITIRRVDRDAPAASPFLPGTKIQYAWDSTSLGYFKTCPRLYQYIMIDGWGEKDTKVHLRFGQEFHQALQDFDIELSNDVTRDDAIHETIRMLLERTADFAPDPMTRAGKYKSRHNLLQLVIDYLDKYEDDPAETYILQDGTPAVELSFRFELDWGPSYIQYKCRVCDTATSDGHVVSNSCGEPCNFVMHPLDGYVPPKQPYMLSGHLDRVVTFQDQLFVMDRKTSMTTLGPYYFNQFEPHNQMSLYTLASQVVIASPIKGVIIDAAQILLEKPNYFARGFTYRTPDQLQEWTNDLKHWLTLAEHYATMSYWPQNDTSCDKFGGCRFREICSKSPQVRERFLASEFVKLPEEDRWNPLKPR